MSEGESQQPQHQWVSWFRSIVLWIGAVLLAAAAMIYQRATGPTYPLSGQFQVAGQNYQYELIRSDWSQETQEAARVTIPDPGPEVTANLYYKRFKTGDPFTKVPMQREEIEGHQKLVGRLPAQPAAGKLAYYLVLETPEGQLRIPQKKRASPQVRQGPLSQLLSFFRPTMGENVIIRFKDHVPETVLWPHIGMMIFTILVGMRAALGALFAPGTMRLLAWLALLGMTIGGMILGPVVQKYAFGEYWTGFPFGGDWTDNKMLVMWIAWLTACTTLGFRPRKKEWPGRIMVVLAALVMTAVYLIPHSMGGSELNYEKLEQGVPASEAIETGT